jgi:sugar lactone lactonase YvrE
MRAIFVGALMALATAVPLGAQESVPVQDLAPAKEATPAPAPAREPDRAGGNDDASAAKPAQAELVPKLRTDLVFNGVTQSRDGRLFSPFQRQERGKGIQLGEWINGKPVPFPDAAWNAWKAGDDVGMAFVGLNAIRIGPDGDLWAVDKGAPDLGGSPLPGGPKLVQIDLSTNKVRRVYPLDVATGPKSFVDDFRFNGRRVYLTDAGEPGLIVLDLSNGHLWRVLDRHPAMTAQRPLTGEGQQLADEKGAPIYIHADQLEVSPDGKTLYFQPCTGPLYRIPTRLVDDPKATELERAKNVAIHAQIGSTGGTAIDGDGNIYASDTDALAILKIAPDGTRTTLIQDKRLVWGDAMWIDEEGGLWIPAAQMNRTKAMNGGTSRVEFPTTIYRMAIGAKPLRN